MLLELVKTHGTMLIHFLLNQNDETQNKNVRLLFYAF